MEWVEDGFVHGFKIWIGDLPASFSNHALRDCLLEVCRVDDINCIRSPKCSTGQWCAILTIRCPHDAQKLYQHLGEVKVHHDDGKPRFIVYKWYNGRRS